MAGMNTDTELLVNAITHQSTMAAESVGLKLSAAELLFVFESIGQAFVKERVTSGDVSFSNVAVLNYNMPVENNGAHKTWCVRDGSDTWHLVTGITGATTDPYVARTACGKVQGVAEQDWGALRVVNCEGCIEAL